MKITKFDNAKKYYQQVESYLLKNEATHCLLLGFKKTLCDSQESNDNFPYLVTVEDQGKIVATAIQTSARRRLIVSKCVDIEAIELIAQDIVSQNESLPGVIAVKLEATTFADKWRSLTGQNFEIAVAMKIHQLKMVEEITQPLGNFRLAWASDRLLLTQWIGAFEAEALGENEPKSDYQSWFERNLQQQSLYVWQDKVTVSMAAFGGATPNGIRISAVYTPPEYRGKGYATACVASLSQKLLNQGYEFCFLFSDLANPTSNHIYRQIGYQAVCEIANLSFKSYRRFQLNGLP